MALVALWYAVAAVATLAIARRRHRLAVPLIAGYLLGAAAIAVVLAATTLRDRVVDERVVAGTRATRWRTRSGRWPSRRSPATSCRVSTRRAARRLW